MGAAQALTHSSLKPHGSSRGHQRGLERPGPLSRVTWLESGGLWLSPWLHCPEGAQKTEKGRQTAGEDRQVAAAAHRGGPEVLGVKSQGKPRS